MIKHIFSKGLIAIFTLLSFISLAQPANDLCAGATSLTLGNPCVNGTTIGAADNIGGAAGCQSGGGVNAHSDVWYTFTSTGTQFTATLTSSAPFAGNLEFILVSGACGTQTITNSVCGASPLSVTINGLTAGTTYYAIVSKQGNGTDGPFTLCNYATTTPTSGCTANDDCSTAQVITLNAVDGGSLCTTGCNTGASPGLDFTGSNCYDTPNATVWYSFTTGATAATINVSLTSTVMTNPEFTIFSNTNGCAGPYTILSCLEGTAGSAVTNAITVTPNTTYYVTVSDATADEGSFNLCIAQNADNSACNTNDALVVSATSMGSPLAGPYKPGEIVSFCYTLTDWQQISCNYLGAVVPTFGSCWDPSSFNAQGMPLNVTTPLNVNGIIQPCPPGPPCAYNACSGQAAGAWNWFPAGSATYNVAGGSLPVGAAMGAGWYFLSSYNPATGSCTGDPTDPDNTFGDGNFPACNTNTFDYTLCFNLTAGAAGNCTTGSTDCGVSIKTYADGEFGAYGSVGCMVDLPATLSGTFECCAQPNMTSTNTATSCSGNVVSIALTSDVASTYSWVATANANVTGESTATQTTSTLSNTLTNTTNSVQTVIYTVTPTSTTGCLGVSQTITVTVNPTPTITVNSPTICSGTSTVLTANSGAVGTTYSWSPGTSLSATTGSAVTSSATTTIQYTVTASLNGCSGAATSTVSVNPTPTITVNSPTICSGTSTVLTANGGAAGTTYSWSPGTNLSATTGSAVTSSATTTIQYTVTATLSGCSGAATSTVTVNPTPTLTVNSPTICSATSTVLTASGGAVGTTYSWSPGTSLSATTGSAVTSSATTTIQYTVTATLNGCSGAATSTVSVNPTPTITVNSPTICSGTSTVLAANGGAAGTTYTWSPGTSLSATTGSAVTSSATTTIQYTVTATLSGCSSSKVSTVTVNATPTITVNSPTICSGTSTVLTANGGAVGTTYTWSPATNLSATTGSVVTASPTTTIQYTVTATLNGCSGAKTSTVTVSPTPTTAASSSGNMTCTTPTITLNSTLAGASYTWTAPSGGILGSANSQNTSASGAGGVYTLNVQSVPGCTFSTTTSVTQNTTAPSGFSAGANQTLTCGSPSVILTGTIGTPINSTLNWTGANVCGTPTTIVTAACGAGVYTLTATDPANGCIQTSTVTVFPSVGSPSVTANAPSNSITCTNTLVTISVATTVTPVTYTWSGTGILAGNGTGTLVVTQGGTFVYSVTAGGCTTSGNIFVVTNTTVPTTTATTSGVITCSTNTVTLNSTLAGMSYTWTAPSGGSVSTASTQSTIGTGIGDYSLTVVNPSNGCTFSTTTTVTQNITPPTLTLSPTSFVLTCASPTVQLTATTTNTDVSYAWTTDGALSNNTISNPIATGSGTYNVIVTNTLTGCQANQTATLTSNQTPPTLTLSPTSVTLTCVSNTVQLNTTTTDTDISYSWTTNGSLNNSTISNPIATGSGTYNVILTNTLTGCQANETATVTSNTTPPTLTLSPMSYVLTCATTTVQLTATTTNTDVSYAWTTDGSLNNNTISNPIATGSGTYNVIVTNTLTGCQANQTATLTSNTTVPTLTLSPMSFALTCASPTVQLIATTTDTNVSYAWTTDGALSSNTISNPIATGSGTYNIIVTNTLTGCQASETATVTQNTPSPTLTLSPMSFVLTCATTTVQLIATTTDTDVNYAWTTNGSLSNATISNPIATGSGTYNVIVTNTLTGCQANQTATLTSNVTPPTLTLSPMSFVLTCATTTVQLIATTTDTDVSYSWTTDGALNNNTISSPIATGSGTYNVIVTNTLTGCQANQTATLTSNTTAPTLTLSPMSFALTCASPTVQLIATTTDTNVSYAWTTDGALSSNTISNPVATGSGTYNVIVTNTLTGCQANKTATVTQNTTPPTLTLSPMSYVLTCANPTVQLIATTTDTDVNYSWTTDGSLSSNTLANPIAAGSGTYNVIVTNTLTGCRANETATLTSNTTPPSVSVTNTVIPCGSPSVTIEAISTNVTYNWTTSGTGSILSVTNMSTAVAGSAGQYVVTVSDNTNGCTNTGTVNVTSTGVTAAFTANPLSGTAPLLVNFTNQSTPGSLSSWIFGDSNNNTSTLTDPSHIFNTPGNYVVTLITADVSGLCSATATLSIEVFENATVIIPNVFTPNGDGSNDLFKITTTGIKELTCDIFNRWGTKLYTIKNTNDLWDGSGAADGTYFFILQATGFDSKEFKQQGFISLFR